MLRFARFLAAALLLLRCTAAAAQEPVHFSSLEDNGPGRSPTMLDGYLFRPAGEGKRAAVVFLHGCGGLFSRASGFINPRELDWARELTQRGYSVLMLDSFGPRNQGEMCSQRGFNREIYMKRPRDAYGRSYSCSRKPGCGPIGSGSWVGRKAAARLSSQSALRASAGPPN